MAQTYKDQARFLTVYIKEAHAQDEWQMSSNEKEGVCYPQPTSLSQRVAIANDFVHRFHYDVPIAVDGMDNRAERLYAAWPERFYILDARGVIVYKGKPGPFGYHPEEVEQWLLAQRSGKPEVKLSLNRLATRDRAEIRSGASTGR